MDHRRGRAGSARCTTRIPPRSRPSRRRPGCRLRRSQRRHGLGSRRCCTSSSGPWRRAGQRLDQHRRLDRHVQAADDPRAGERPCRAELLAQGHQIRHLGLGDRDLAASQRGRRVDRRVNELRYINAPTHPGLEGECRQSSPRPASEERQDRGCRINNGLPGDRRQSAQRRDRNLAPPLRGVPIMKSRNKAPMNARDVMTKPVVSVHPDTSLREIARLLLDKGISAVPVVDVRGRR